ncbi:MAG: hypothetical protein HYU86_02020 [Chloroflexi bacterium]|nr:hypothetical protein [Chloroflexota bacterium]
MKAKAVRLSDPLLRGVELLQRREALDASAATRKLLHMGLERYVAQLYREGELTLREVAALLELPLREAMNRLERLGASGNVTSAQSLRALALDPGDSD